MDQGTSSEAGLAVLSTFVIGPIGDRDAEAGSVERANFEEAIIVFEEVIEPACRAFGLTPTRADMMSSPGEIPDQVFRLLRDSHLVIADVSDANPNVMYELGLRHTTGKLTIQIGERGKLPFDIAAIRTIKFRRSEGGWVEARRKLTQAIAVGLERGGDPVAATRVWFEQDLGHTDLEEQTTAESEAPEIAGVYEEPGVLDKLSDLEEALASINQVMEAGANVQKEMGELARTATERLQKADKTPKSISAKLAIVNSLAARLEDPASRLEVMGGELVRSVERADPGTRYLLMQVQSDPKLAEVKPTFLAAVSGMVRSYAEMLQATGELKEALASAGEASRVLRRVNKRISAALSLYNRAQPILDEWRRLAGLESGDDSSGA